MKISRSMLANSLVTLAAFAAVAALEAGCAETKASTPGSQIPSSRTPAVSAQVENTSALAASPSGKTGLETPALHVSDEIASACNLPKTEFAPNFDYDSDAIGDQDRVVLSALAKCLSDGPLQGRGLALTGRADPRGEPEYNMSLGETRADSVRRYLHDLGVQAERLRATSRGEIDATGVDEAGWAHDRRVDIDLTN